MKSNKELLIDKEHVKIKKETFDNIKEVINETKNVMEVQPKLESALKQVDSFTTSYKSLQMTTNKLTKEVENLKEDNERLREENKSLKQVISDLLHKIKEFFRDVLFHGNNHSKNEVESQVIDMYFDDDFNKNDVYQVSRGTSKEDNLFAIAGIPNSYKEFNIKKKGSEKAVKNINDELDEAAEEFDNMFGDEDNTKDDDFEL